MIRPTADLARRLSAWHAAVVLENGQSDRVSVAFDQMQPHCAALKLSFRSSSDRPASSTQLGEVLRVISMVAAPNVDPSVWNLLWWEHEGGLCAKDSAYCSRCDGLERSTPAVVKLRVHGSSRSWTGEVVLYEALYAWDESAASEEFKQLRAELERPAPQPLQLTSTIQLRLVIGEIDSIVRLADVLRDTYKLLDRPPVIAPQVVEIVCLHVKPGGRDSSLEESKSILTSIFNSGLPVVFTRKGASPDPSYELWDSLLKADAPSVFKLKVDSFIDHELRIIWLSTFFATRCHSLKALKWHWHLDSAGLDPQQRLLAASAIGMALFSPTSTLQAKKFGLDLGQLSESDVDAIERGALGTGTADSSTNRFYSVEWTVVPLSNETIVRIARLLGAVGVSYLTIRVNDRRISCRTLRCVLGACPTMQHLTVLGLQCEDWSELQPDQWPSYRGQLQDLQLRVGEGGGQPATLALDYLLAHVGSQLTRLSLSTYDIKSEGYNGEAVVQISAATVEVIASRCPNLTSLRFGSTDIASFERLVEVLDAKRLCLRSITAGAGSTTENVPWLPLLHALSDSERLVSRSLQELHILQVLRTPKPRRSKSLRPSVDAWLAMAAANRTLRRVHQLSYVFNSIKQAIAGLPHQYVARPLMMRCVLALLSVNQRLPLLDADVVRQILEFAGRPMHRYKYSAGKSFKCSHCFLATTVITT